MLKLGVREQVKAETSCGRGHAKSAEAKSRRRDTCGKLGHNARTCLMEDTLSKENESD